MKKIVVILIVIVSLYVSNGFCLEIKPTDKIAVEKLTGRGGDNEFSGWVGSMTIDFENRLIYIAEFSQVVPPRAAVIVGLYKITKLEKTAKNINFECVDNQTGLVWRGKVWPQDKFGLNVEMIMRDSPRRWVNLGKLGRDYMDKIGLNVFLGV